MQHYDLLPTFRQGKIKVGKLCLPEGFFGGICICIRSF